MIILSYMPSRVAEMRFYMKGYLSIGKVSKLKNVSIKSLRYYDEIGVLKPAYINTQTNYRYYKEEQLFLLDAITLCIELGIPLKSFPNYLDKHGELNIQKLLFDGKALAEQKIINMRNCIDQLQHTLDSIAAKSTPAFPQKHVAKRYILTIPFDEVTSCVRYNHMLLSLFVGAQRNGITASYPSGLLYEWNKGKLERYVFVHAVPPSDSPLPTGMRQLPSGSYYYMQSDVHHIDEGQDIFSSVLSDRGHDHFIFVETDILEKDLGNADRSLELQLLML